MFGQPVQRIKTMAVFNLIWSYGIKAEDGRKKARCTCDGSTRGGAVRVLDHVHANSIDQTGSRIFYALSAVENKLVFGSMSLMPSVKPRPLNKVFIFFPARPFKRGGSPKVVIQFLTTMSFLFKLPCRVILKQDGSGKNTSIKSSAEIFI
jgi:hypothetical protein